MYFKSSHNKKNIFRVSYS